MVSGIPRKHAHSLQRLYSLAFGCGTFAYAKDQASLPLDGLRKDYPTQCSNDLSGLKKQEDYRMFPEEMSICHQRPVSGT